MSTEMAVVVTATMLVPLAAYAAYLGVIAIHNVATALAERMDDDNDVLML